MCKKALSVIVLLFSGVWAYAQQSQPGYAVLTTDQGSARFSGGSAASPPEPAAVGVQGGGPIVGPPTGGMGYPSAPGMMGGMGYPGGPGSPGMPGMGGPGMGGPGMGGPGMPYSADPGMPGSPLGGSVGPTSLLGTEKVWGSMDYVAAWLQRPRLTTPLVTQGSTADNFPGALQQPGTTVLYGENNYNFKAYSGFTASVGVNLDDHFYLEVNGLVLPSQSSSSVFASDSGGNPVIARPVVAMGQNLTYFTAFPGIIAGQTSILSDSMLWGIEAAARYKFDITPYLQADILLGFREMQLKEDLQINDFLTPLVPSINFLGNQVAPGQGTYFTDFDKFSTLNTFYGVDFGGRIRWQSGFDWLAVTSYWKEALGSTYQSVNINGATTLVTPSSTTTVPGGVLAQQSNIGGFSRNVFGSITEGGVGLVFTPCKYVRLDVGYSALYWSSVLRPGNQINPNVTPTQVPTNNVFSGPAAGSSPTFTYRPQGMTVQSVNVGLTLYY